jgi:membrane protease YdiL (CAAX protease family)
VILRRLGGRLVNVVIGIALVAVFTTTLDRVASRPRALAVGLAALTSVLVEMWTTTRWGATLGQRLFRLKTVGPDGRPPTLAAAWLRVAALGPFAVGAPLCGIGVLRRGHRGAHDRASLTAVLPAGRASALLPWPGPLGRPPLSPGDAVTPMWTGVWVSIVVSLIASGVGATASPTATFLIILPAQSAGTISTLIALTRLKGSGSLRADLGLTVRWRDGAYLLLGPPLHIVAGIVIAPLLALLGRTDPPVQGVSSDAANATGLLVTMATVIGLVVVGPVTEELVFRGVLLRGLLGRTTETRAVAISAAAFAFVHLLDPAAWPIVPGLFVLGWVLARLTLGPDRTLSKAILAHAGFNLVSVIASRFV